MQITRRRFLLQVGAAAAAGASAPLWLELAQRSGLPFAWGVGEGDVLPEGTPICVHIAMDGGNDYLNTLVPFEDPWYRDAAVGHGSALALTESETLSLADTSYRLHRGLPWLANRWNTVRDVGFALGVGNLRQNFSHFDSMKYWQTARLDVVGKSGWLGRFADEVRPRNPLASVSMTDLRREAVATRASVLVVQHCAGFAYTAPQLSRTAFLENTKAMSQSMAAGVTGDVARMIGTTFGISDRVRSADDPRQTGSASGYTALVPLAQQLVQAALLIKAGVPAQSYTMGFGPFDSHINQKAMQSARFAELDQALSKFFGLLAGHRRQNDVFVLITSEFGRQCTANLRLGTDHGQAGMAIFIGGGVNGGVYGSAPTLDPGGPTAPNRYADAPIPTVDFRSVHATTLTRLAKGDANVADTVLGATYEDLGLFGPLLPPPSPSTTTTVPPTTTTSRPPTSTTTTPVGTNKAPVAAMTLSPLSGPVPLTVSADGSSSRDPDGYIKVYQWKWGDGTTANYGKKATHQFTKRGTFTVRLTVKDDKGAIAYVTKTVKVT